MKIVLILINWEAKPASKPLYLGGRVQMGRRGLHMGAVAIIPREFC